MVNKMILQGRLVADPELSAKNDLTFCNFRVAWSDKYKEHETKLFMSCIAFRHTAEFLSKYFKKGQQIVVEGRLVTNTWEKDGETKSKIKMEVEKAHFCGDKKDNGAASEPLAEVTPLDDLPW